MARDENCHCEERSDEAISKKKRGTELSLRTPNRGEAISKRRGRGSLPLASAPCHPREGGDLPVAYATPSPRGTPPKTPGSSSKKNNAGGEPSVFCRLECGCLGWGRGLIILYTTNRKIPCFF